MRIDVHVFKYHVERGGGLLEKERVASRGTDSFSLEQTLFKSKKKKKKKKKRLKELSLLKVFSSAHLAKE